MLGLKEGEQPGDDQGGGRTKENEGMHNMDPGVQKQDGRQNYNIGK